MKNTIWLSYDLGVNGDYEGIYSWLDNLGAKECGSSIAVLRYSHEGNLLESLENDVRGAVALDKRSRIYVIRMDDGKMRGRYIVGRRRGAPWEGFGDRAGDEEDAE